MRVYFSKSANETVFDRNVTDLIKFISCVLIALGHWSGYASVQGFNNPIFGAIAVNFGGIGVALFFLFSGYGLMISERKNHLPFITFCRRRIMKTYLPAVLVSALWLLVCYVIDARHLLCNNQYLLGVVWHFNDEVMWFVNTILVLYVFFYIYVLIERKIKSQDRGGVCIGRHNLLLL